MGKLILYSTNLSPAVRTVQLTAKYLGLELELRNVNLAADEHKTEEFLKMNPQHTVPVLDDDGEIFWDSHAISTYLCDRYASASGGTDLYPNDLIKRAKINQRLFFNCGILFATLRRCFLQVFYEGLTEFTPKMYDEVDDLYRLLEIFIKDNYVIGNTLTVADFACSATVLTLELLLPVDPVKYPNITGWLTRLTNELPYFQEINRNPIYSYRKFLNQCFEVNRFAAAGEISNKL